MSLAVAPGDRIGVVGPNGSGKTTLLHLLAGRDQPERGRVHRAQPSLEVALFPQELDVPPGETVRGFLARRTGVAEAERTLDTLVDGLADDPSLAAAHEEALRRFVALGGMELPSRSAGALAEVGLEPSALDRPLAALSGGERARAGLAALLLARFDVVLLDEPTNDLDFDGLARLERFLDEMPAGAVVVSHDRAFLDRVVTRILELEEGTRRATEYQGGWREYEAERERRRAAAGNRYGRYAGERARLVERLGHRRSEARAGGRQANRRATKALTSKVRAVERRLDRLEPVEKPWAPWELHLELGPNLPAGDVVVRLDAAVVRRGSFTLGPLDLEVRRGGRLAVSGRNGSGKTTLLEALLGRAPLASGRRVVGPSTVFAELDQDRTTFAPGEPLLPAFVRASGLGEEAARTLLAKLGLGAEDVSRAAGSLSPGERSRAVLAVLAAGEANCLVLDEPTNHLDLPAIEELERALAAYEGTLVLVTHDRRFLERVEPTRTIRLPGTRC